MKNRKIINDPVHGFITIPYESTMHLIEHPYVQRLRRIKQLGMTDYVYPGAVHTRFHHALGAMHLMTEALRTLQYKGIDITEEECEAAVAAILLHDIGHGPYSHALEHRIVPYSHERIGLALMDRINSEVSGKLDKAIEIFKGTYKKPFLHDLVSSQLDMDRMDYLARDSFFTGVTEGLIGHARIIKMLNVKDGRLVVEEKALRSIEKFLHARHFMYWQVYLHKTVLSTEVMLQRLYDRLKLVLRPNDGQYIGHTLYRALQLDQNSDQDLILDVFSTIDDTDIMYAIKQLQDHDDRLVGLLAKGLSKRRLFKLFLHQDPKECALHFEARLNTMADSRSNQALLMELKTTGSEKTTFYNTDLNQIRVLMKDDSVVGLSKVLPMTESGKDLLMHYVSYPSPSLLEDLRSYKETIQPPNKE